MLFSELLMEQKEEVRNECFSLVTLFDSEHLMTVIDNFIEEQNKLPKEYIPYHQFAIARIKVWQLICSVLLTLLPTVLFCDMEQKPCDRVFNIYEGKQGVVANREVLCSRIKKCIVLVISDH